MRTTSHRCTAGGAWQVFAFKFVNSFISQYYYAFSHRNEFLQLSVQVRCRASPLDAPRTVCARLIGRW